MERVSNQEYLRRRKLAPYEMTPAELAAWWDFPDDWRGFADIEIGGKDLWIDFTKGSVPCVITRPYLPC